MSLVDDEIYTKPNCSPMCEHEKVCTRCNRPKCIKSMVHSRLHGYTCHCGNQEWENLFDPKRADIKNREVTARLLVKLNNKKRDLSSLVNHLANIILEIDGASDNDRYEAEEAIKKVLNDL